MRWDQLFADLEGQLAAEQRRQRDDEVAERTRRERALVPLAARLAARVGADVEVGLHGGLRVSGRLEDLGADWLLVRRRAQDREVLVPLSAIVLLPSLGSESSPERAARRFGLGYALRALSRDRSTVAVSLLGGATDLVGTVDSVGADHLDLAEHAEDLPRRRENVRATTTVPFSALAAVESRH
jgi:hypothetical protein